MNEFANGLTGRGSPAVRADTWARSVTFIVVLPCESSAKRPKASALFAGCIRE
jgi:hypothetical protein